MNLEQFNAIKAECKSRADQMTLEQIKLITEGTNIDTLVVREVNKKDQNIRLIQMFLAIRDRLIQLDVYSPTGYTL